MDVNEGNGLETTTEAPAIAGLPDSTLEPDAANDASDFEARFTDPAFALAEYKKQQARAETLPPDTAGPAGRMNGLRSAGRPAACASRG